MLLQAPKVQNFVIQKVTSSLSEELGTPIEIDKIEIKFFRSLHIEHLFAADQNADTLLYLHTLDAKLGLFSLLQQKIALDHIQITGLRSTLTRPSTTSDFNYQYLIDHFSSPSPSTPSDQSSNWEIQYGRLTLKDAQFNWLDSLQKNYLNCRIGQLQIATNKLDFVKQSIDLNRVSLSDAQVAYISSPSPDSTKTTTNQALSFPYTGWDILVDELQLSDNAFLYQATNKPAQQGVIDFNHLKLNELQVNMRDFNWQADGLQADLVDLQLKDHSGFSIEEGQFAARLDSQTIKLQGLSLLTPNSRIQNEAQLQFSTWNDLPHFLDSVDYQIQLQDTYLSTSDIAYFLSYLPADYRRLRDPIQISTQINGQQGEIDIAQLALQVGDWARGEAQGRLWGLPSIEQLRFDVDLKDIQLQPARLRAVLPNLNLPAGLDSLGQLALSTHLSGQVADFEATQLALRTSVGPYLNGRVRLKNITQVQELSFDCMIDSLLVLPASIASFSPNSLPEMVDRLQYLQYRGELKGGLYDYQSKGRFDSALGGLNTDLSIQFASDYRNADYSGVLELDAFELGRLLGDSTGLGAIALELEADGAGLSLEQLDAELEATIRRVEYRDFAYENIFIRGGVKEERFVGEAKMGDKNVAFDFDGMVDLKAQPSQFTFVAAIDSVHLDQLNLYPSPLLIKAKTTANFTGQNIDDFSGELSFKELYLANDTTSFLADSIYLYSDQKIKSDKQLSLRSDLITANLEGDFNLQKLPQLLVNMVNNYFPIDQWISLDDRADSLALATNLSTTNPEQSFNFQFITQHPEQLTKLFTPTLETLPYGKIEGQINSAKDQLDFTLSTPMVKVSGWQVDSFQVEANGTPDRFKAQILLPHLHNGPTSFAQNQSTLIIEDQQLNLNWTINDEDEANLFSWGARLRPADSLYILQMVDSLQLAEQYWSTNKNHEILFNQSAYEFLNFQLSNQEQSIQINSENQKFNSPIFIDFNKFKLAPIAQLINIPSFQFKGLMNGRLTLKDLLTEPSFLSDLDINNFVLNDSLVGNIQIDLSQEIFYMKLGRKF